MAEQARGRHRAGRLLPAVVAAGLVAAGCGGGPAQPTSAPRTPGAATGGPGTARAASPPPSPSAVPTTVTVTVRSGQVVEGPAEVEVGVGERVRLTVVSDRADQIHVHGYDRTAPVSAGGTATVMFTADIPGQFEVELEQSGLQLFELVVR